MQMRFRHVSAYQLRVRTKTRWIKSLSVTSTLAWAKWFCQGILRTLSLTTCPTGVMLDQNGLWCFSEELSTTTRFTLSSVRIFMTLRHMLPQCCLSSVCGWAQAAIAILEHMASLNTCTLAGASCGSWDTVHKNVHDVWVLVDLYFLCIISQ